MKYYIIELIKLTFFMCLISGCADRRTAQNEQSAKMLALAAVAYASDATGFHPASESEIYNAEILKEKCFYITPKGERLEFQYLGPLAISDGADLLLIVAPVAEKNGTRLVVRTDCQIEYLEQAELAKILSRTTKAVEKNKRVHKQR